MTFSSPYRTALAGVSLVFLFRLLLAMAVVPPWQNPDEPQHFAFVRLLSRQATLDLSSRRDVEIEREILQSMAQHGWWTHYGEPTPDPVPTTFSAVPAHINVVLVFPPVYYVLAAYWLKALGVVPLLDQYYALRWLGILLAVPTLWCFWAGARLLFGERVAIGTAMLVALHPQFALVSIAVNADVLVNLCGAVVWWQAARLVTGRTPVVSVLSMIAVTAIAVFTKRSSAPLVGITGVMCAYGVGHLARRQTRAAMKLAVATVVGIVAVAGAAYLVPAEVARVAGYWRHLLTFSAAGRALNVEFFGRFAAGFFDSAWLMAGWLRYPAPSPWLLTVRILVLVAVVGLIVPRWRQAEARLKPGVLLAATFVVIYLGGIGAGYYLNAFGAQGRFLFPIIGPWMSLLWIGVCGWWPHRFWPLAGVALLGLMLLLDVIAWTTVLIPTYVP